MKHLGMLFIAVLLLGCTGLQNGVDPVSSAKSFDAIQGFLKEHPDAKIVSQYLTKDKAALVLKKYSECDLVDAQPMYYVTFKDDQLTAAAFISIRQDPLCIITAPPTAPSATPTPSAKPTEKPTVTSDPGKNSDYCTPEGQSLSDIYGEIGKCCAGLNPYPGPNEGPICLKSENAPTPTPSDPVIIERACVPEGEFLPDFFDPVGGNTDYPVCCPGLKSYLTSRGEGGLCLKPENAPSPTPTPLPFPSCESVGGTCKVGVYVGGMLSESCGTGWEEIQQSVSCQDIGLPSDPKPFCCKRVVSEPFSEAFSGPFTDEDFTSSPDLLHLPYLRTRTSNFNLRLLEDDSISRIRFNLFNDTGFAVRWLSRTTPSIDPIDSNTTYYTWIGSVESRPELSVIVHVGKKRYDVVDALVISGELARGQDANRTIFYSFETKGTLHLDPRVNPGYPVHLAPYVIANGAGDWNIPIKVMETNPSFIARLD